MKLNQNRLPPLVVLGGVPFVQSNVAADYLGKRHANLLVHIAGVMAGLARKPRPGAAGARFERSTYVGAGGVVRPCFLLNRAAFELLKLGRATENGIDPLAARADILALFDKLLGLDDVGRHVNAVGAAIAASVAAFAPPVLKGQSKPADERLPVAPAAHSPGADPVELVAADPEKIVRLFQLLRARFDDAADRALILARVSHGLVGAKQGAFELGA